MKKEMFYTAIAPIFHNARELRNRSTEPERILWNYLRTRPEGYKFRRQHPTAHYILDFYCHALKLAIEADGSYHDTAEVQMADIERQKHLAAQGIKYIRFVNEEIIQRLETVIDKIDYAIDEHLEKEEIILSMIANKDYD